MVTSTPRNAITPAPLKRCACCGKSFPINEFGINRQAKDGLNYYSKKCAAARQKKWAAENAETVKRMRRDYLKRIRELNDNRDPYASLKACAA